LAIPYLPAGLELFRGARNLIPNSNLCIGGLPKKIEENAGIIFYIDQITTGKQLLKDLNYLKDKKIANHVHAMIVPGSGLVKEQAEQEGLDKIFLQSGFEWREPGCSMCLAMNADKLKPEEGLAGTNKRFLERFAYIEETLGGNFKKSSADELTTLWELAKKENKQGKV